MKVLQTTILAAVGLTAVLGHHCTLEVETACSLGGGLALKSQPNGLEVDKDRCDPLYPKQDFAAQPHLTFAQAKPGSKYTIVMADPDAPNHKKGQYYLHWILSNISGEDLVEGNLDKGTIITKYKGPAPPEGSGVHRYMFFVMEQEEGLTVNAPVADEQRRNWVFTEWLNSLHHSVKCQPAAGAQFRSQFD